jgi:DNA-binding NarL/FixJ family response regulator
MKPWRLMLADRDGERCTSWVNEFAKLQAFENVRFLDALDDLHSLENEFPFEAVLVSAASYTPSEVLSSIEWIRRTQPACRVIVFAVPQDGRQAIEYLEAGAWAVLADRVTTRGIEQCVVSAARGEVVLSPAMAGEVLQRIRQLSLVRVEGPPSADAFRSLTRREREILSLIARRFSNQEIARELVVEVGTVKNHVHSVLKKLGVATRYEAAAFGLEAAASAERVSV